MLIPNLLFSTVPKVYTSNLHGTLKRFDGSRTLCSASPVESPIFDRKIEHELITSVNFNKT
jgi:hypothetical protein